MMCNGKTIQKPTGAIFQGRVKRPQCRVETRDLFDLGFSDVIEVVTLVTSEVGGASSDGVVGGGGVVDGGGVVEEGTMNVCWDGNGCLW